MMIRHLHSSDFPSLLMLGAQLFRPEDELPDLKKALDVCFLELSYVAVENGCILGFTVICPPMTTVINSTILPFRSGSISCPFRSGSIELAFFGVSPACQGRGIGSRLLKETLHTLFQRSYLFVWLLVNVSNESALRMYETRGFCRWRKIWPDGAPEACWAMVLAMKPYPHVSPPLSAMECTHAIECIPSLVI